MKNKINKARNILSKISNGVLQNNQNDIVLRLKETTDMAELIYNDFKIKRFKSSAASRSMKESEKKLEEILLMVINETGKNKG